jgi:hypothetical protein
MIIPAYVLQRNSVPSARCQSLIWNENFGVPITTELRPFSTLPVTDVEYGSRRTYYNRTSSPQRVARHWYWVRIPAYLLQRNSVPSARCQSLILNKDPGVSITTGLRPFSALPFLEAEWEFRCASYNGTPSLQHVASHWYWMRIPAFLLQRNSVPSARCPSRILNEDSGLPLTTELHPFSTLPVTDTEWGNRRTCYNGIPSLQHVASHWDWLEIPAYLLQYNTRRQVRS